jgi:triacylglycerol lipase
MGVISYSKLDIIDPPGKYGWFDYHQTHPFDYDTLLYSPINATWLAECSRLVYLRDNERVAAQLINAGFVNVHFYDCEGTQAFVAIGTHVIVIAFRGTELNEFKDIKTDMDFLFTDSENGGKVHNGFQHALDLIWPEMECCIQTNKHGRSIWWCGHSLGGALATIAASRFGGHGLYTFGSPRVGDSKFAKRVKYLIPHFRFVHNDDIVPQLPPPIFFRHTGHMIYISHVGELIHNARWWHRWVDDVIMRGQWVLHKFGAVNNGSLGLLDGITDHCVITYTQKVKAASLQT